MCLMQTFVNRSDPLLQAHFATICNRLYALDLFLVEINSFIQKYEMTLTWYPFSELDHALDTRGD